jgi:hypothetical protein
MRWSSFTSTDIIAGIFTVIISGIIILFILLIARIFSLNDNEKITLNSIFRPREITSKDLVLKVSQHTSPTEPAVRETTVVDSTETAGKNKVQVNFYIIVGSFRNLMEAKLKAEKLIKDFNTNIIVLPPTIQGNYRISYGKYSTLEEAKAIIINIRKTIKSDAWILSVKE